MASLKIMPLGKHVEIQTMILNMQTFTMHFPWLSSFLFPSTSLIEKSLTNSRSFERGQHFSISASVLCTNSTRKYKS